MMPTSKRTRQPNVHRAGQASLMIRLVRYATTLLPPSRGRVGVGGRHPDQGSAPPKPFPARGEGFKPIGLTKVLWVSGGLPCQDLARLVVGKVGAQMADGVGVRQQDAAVLLEADYPGGARRLRGDALQAQADD